MPWSDDTRCLYCDGKLPLFRKLAHGQFCSKAHQKKYWDEQQALVVERLHQTHNDIQAYKPPGPIESILGPTGPEPENDYSFLDAEAESILGPTEPPPFETLVAARADTPAYTPAETLADLGVTDGPPIAEFLATAIDPISSQLTTFVATGSLDLQPVLRPQTPVWAAPGAVGATLRLRAVADYVWWQQEPANVALVDSAWQSAVAFSPSVQHPSLNLAIFVPNPASQVVPALEQQLAIAPPAPLSGGTAMQVNDPAPLPASGEILRATHGFSAYHAGLRTLQEQLSISAPAPRTAVMAPRTMMMAAAVSGPSHTLPAFSARPRGPAFEVVSGYEPPLVEKLKAIQLTAQRTPQTALNLRAALQSDYVSVPTSPEAGFSNFPALSAPVELRVPGLQQLTLAGVAPHPAPSAEPHSLDRHSGETQRPVLEGVAVPVSGLVPCQMQPLPLEPQPAQDLPHSDLQPLAVALSEAARLEPKLIGAPLAPHYELSLVSLPLSLDLSSAPAWDPAPSRALTPQISAMLPSSGCAVMTLELEPVEEAAPIEGPIDIPSPAGHVAMEYALAVSPADIQAKPVLARNPIPESLPGQQLYPKVWIKPMKVVFTPPAVEVDPTSVPGAVIEAEAARRGGLAGIRGFWKSAPRDLKILACVIPVLIGLAFQTLPKVSVDAPETDVPGGFMQVVKGQYASFMHSVANRAAVALDEDFRGGIDHWLSRTGATAEWSFNSTGFVQPGPLALYEPSLKLTDYQMQFLGMIDDKALSWVARADGFENYYVIKLVVLKPGPLPTIGLTRYAVINGKPVDRVDRPVPINARADTIYRIRMDVHGSTFALEVQGQMIDSWNEPRLKQGGVGFFTGNGEKSSIRWVQITHQYDTLGRLCAYLAPIEF